MRSHNPFKGRHHRSDSHLKTCTECASAVRRERDYLEKLREAAIPPASHDLTARLLDRTHMLALAPCEPAGAPRRGARVLAITAGGTVAAAGVLAAGAFALAGEPLPMPANPAAANFSQQASRLPADGRELSTAQLAELRTEGWVCPELESLGFHVLTARATTLDGRPAVEMELSDGQHYARVLEQHGLYGQSGAGVPVGSGTPSGDGQVWIRNLAPWTAVYTSPESTFTYESDLPADRADDALPVLQQLSDVAGTGVSAAAAPGPAAEAAGTPAESFRDRIGRGIHKMLQFLDP